ncbi:MAG: hypothetical protein QNJ37_16595 [Crocosphaera sp.]|nr:hypothetical protein [Crocosphaera sp.]
MILNVGRVGSVGRRGDGVILSVEREGSVGRVGSVGRLEEYQYFSLPAPSAFPAPSAPLSPLSPFAPPSPKTRDRLTL